MFQSVANDCVRKWVPKACSVCRGIEAASAGVGSGTETGGAGGTIGTPATLVDRESIADGFDNGRTGICDLSSSVPVGADEGARIAPGLSPVPVVTSTQALRWSPRATVPGLFSGPPSGRGARRLVSSLARDISAR